MVVISIYGKQQKGIAMIAALFFLVVVTALATIAITLATVQVKVAGGVSCWETALAAAEGGINYVAPLIQNVVYSGGTIPDIYSASVTSAAVFSSKMTQPTLWNILGDVNNSPDVTMSLPGLLYPVKITVMPSGVGVQPGGAIEAAWAYHGNTGSSGLVSGFTIVSRACPVCANAEVQQVFWLKTVL